MRTLVALVLVFACVGRCHSQVYEGADAGTQVDAARAEAEAAVLADAPVSPTLVDSGCTALLSQLRAEVSVVPPGSEPLALRCVEVPTTDPVTAADLVAEWVRTLSPVYRPDDRRVLETRGPSNEEHRTLYSESVVVAVNTPADPLFAEYSWESRTRPVTDRVWVTVQVFALRR